MEAVSIESETYEEYEYYYGKKLLEKNCIFIE